MRKTTAGAGATPRPGRGGVPALRRTSGSGHAAGRSRRQLSRAGGALKSKVRHAGEDLRAGGLSPPYGPRRRGVAMVPRDEQRRAVKSRVGIINRRNRDGGREAETCHRFASCARVCESRRSHPVRVCAIVDGHRNNTGRLGIINRRNRDGERASESRRSHPVRVCAIVDGHRNNTGRRYLDRTSGMAPQQGASAARIHATPRTRTN